MSDRKKINVAVFASGRGSNARALAEQASGYNYKVKLIVSNKPDAAVLQYAAEQKIDTLILDRNDFYNTTELLSQLKKHDIELIVLAGFLWLVPAYLIDAFEGKIINIHPSILPRHGGKGMYGIKVHEAVKAAGDTETGITIHLVNKEYDKGEILLQEKIAVHTNDTPQQIAEKVLKLEHQFLPLATHRLAASLF
jgi:phosphoribosylglycinamide formyltransferase 1